MPVFGHEGPRHTKKRGRGYAASKYAVVGFGEDVRYEMSFHNIKATTVCPGAVDTMIFYRSLDYKIHRELPGPQDPISIDQAADEILEGVEEGRGILPIQDFARKMHHAIGTNPSEVDETMWNLARTRREDPLCKVGVGSGE